MKKLAKVIFILSLIVKGISIFALGCPSRDPLLFVHVSPKSPDECPAIVHLKVLEVKNNDQLKVQVLEILNYHTHLPQLVAGQTVDIDASALLLMALGGHLKEFELGSEWVVLIYFDPFRPIGKRLRVPGCQETIPIKNGIAKGQISGEIIETIPISELRKRVNSWVKSNFGLNKAR